jgi:anaerobic magnesium-protoporphyrin IX monomethyl ester cyclase
MAPGSGPLYPFLSALEGIVRIVLADVHGTVLGKDQTSANLSLLYLASYLKAQRVDVEFVYLPQARTISEHLECVQSFRPQFYAISFTSYSARAAYQLIRRVKAEFPEVVVVCGGAHVTPFPADVLEKSGADVCVLSEGEVTFSEIVAAYGDLPRALHEIDGVAFLDRGRLVRTSRRAILPDLDAIPFPLRDLVNDRDFCGLTYSKARPNTEMVITRGCPLRCVFCANPVFRFQKGPLFRARSPENIVAEVEDLYRRGYREIYLHSDELNVRLDWSVEVCKAIASLGYRDLFFQCNMRAVPMSAELAHWMKRAGFWLVRMGIESSSDRVLRGIKKRMARKNTVNACRLLRAEGIKVFGFMMMFNFWEENGQLEHETAEEVRQSIRDTYKLWRQGLLNYTSWAFAVPVQGAELYDIARRRGFVDADYYPTDTWNCYEFLDGVSQREFNRLYAKARRQQALMALTAGNFEWRNYKGILRKARTMLFGKPRGTSSQGAIAAAPSHTTRSLPVLGRGRSSERTRAAGQR